MSMKLLLENPLLSERYNKIKKHFNIRESAYDVTSKCQLRCDGCFYFSGEKYKVKDTKDVELWRRFMSGEKARGINYVNLAGAEPAFVPAVLQACYDTIPNGTIFSNGLRPIDKSIDYRVHISVWGNGAGDPVYRKYANGKTGSYFLPVQLENYSGDDRAVFVYTFNAENTDQVDDVMKLIADAGKKVTFNVFSLPEGDHSTLKIDSVLKRTREKMIMCLEQYPQNVLFSYYSALVHTSKGSLRDLFGCPYPRAAKRNFGISQTFRSYRSDLTHVKECDCCVPDTDCSNCRHYAAGSTIVTSRLDLHSRSESLFRGWLDYIDNYLAVWVKGYEKDPSYLFDYDLFARSEDMAGTSFCNVEKLV